MGSVIDYIECPNCGHEAHSDFYYKTGEEYVMCNNCGYRRTAELKRDEDGELVTIDGTERYDFDNLTMVYNELENPYGAFRYKFVGDIGTVCGTLETEDALTDFITTMELNENGAIEYAAYSRLIDGEIVETILINDIKENEDGTIIYD
jgi:DNA-directed RNA polymerase subunit RPC12/RpoP